MPSFKATVPFDLGRGLAKIDTDLLWTMWF